MGRIAGLMDRLGLVGRVAGLLLGLLGVLAAVFAGVVVAADVVIPVSVHEAAVAVAERALVDGTLAGAGRLQNTGALLQSRRAVVVAIVTLLAVASTSLLRVGLGEVGLDSGVRLDLDGGDSGGEDSNGAKKFHLEL